MYCTTYQMGKGTVSGGSPIAWVKYVPFLIGLQVRLPGSDHIASSPFSILNQPIYTPQRKLEAKSARSLQYQHSLSDYVQLIALLVSAV